MAAVTKSLEDNVPLLREIYGLSLRMEAGPGCAAAGPQQQPCSTTALAAALAEGAVRCLADWPALAAAARALMQDPGSGSLVPELGVSPAQLLPRLERFAAEALEALQQDILLPVFQEEMFSQLQAGGHMQAERLPKQPPQALQEFGSCLSLHISMCKLTHALTAALGAGRLTWRQLNVGCSRGAIYWLGGKGVVAAGRATEHMYHQLPPDAQADEHRVRWVSRLSAKHGALWLKRNATWHGSPG